jgi:hypothetical protein
MVAFSLAILRPNDSLWGVEQVVKAKTFDDTAAKQAIVSVRLIVDIISSLSGILNWSGSGGNAQCAQVLVNGV